MRDLARLDEFLRSKNAKAADTVSLLIEKALHRLARFPDLGRLIDDHPGYRELYLPYGASAYAIRYRHIENDVVVVRVWHSRELRS
ncbi:MAG: type II toxin-antitoxin system RelE/ParE family toxin [Myxococcaceae bacterium]|nr:type II toxin-antitoxin system RelE/ParE family toxin [Myxococcaceae bacterium]